MTSLTSMTSLEPLTTNLAAYTYTTTETGFTWKITAEYDSWTTWSAEVAATETYSVTDQDTINQEKFSGFLISNEITSTATDDGVCMISSVYGTVCLLQNSGDDGMDTYRINTSKWATAIAAYSTN